MLKIQNNTRNECKRSKTTLETSVVFSAAGAVGASATDVNGRFVSIQSAATGQLETLKTNLKTKLEEVEKVKKYTRNE